MNLSETKYVKLLYIANNCQHLKERKIEYFGKYNNAKYQTNMWQFFLRKCRLKSLQLARNVVEAFLEIIESAKNVTEWLNILSLKC